MGTFNIHISKYQEMIIVEIKKSILLQIQLRRNENVYQCHQQAFRFGMRITRKLLRMSHIAAIARWWKPKQFHVREFETHIPATSTHAYVWTQCQRCCKCFFAQNKNMYQCHRQVFRFGMRIAKKLFCMSHIAAIAR